jgi:hypothetical protein
VRRQNRRKAVIAAAAVVALGAVVTAGLLLYPGRAAPPTAGRSPAPPDPVRGRFPAAPPACSLLTSAQAAGLGAGTSAAARSQGCSWGDGIKGGSIDLNLQTFAPRGSLDAPNLAQAYYADKRRQIAISAHADDKIHSAQTAVTDVPATGDAAFVYDATDGIDAGHSSTVWLRSSNLVIEVAYADHTGGTATAEVHRRAVEAARAVSDHLSHL